MDLYYETKESRVKAAYFYEPGQIRVEDGEAPGIRDSEMLIRVRAASICGTDLRIFKHGHFKIPAGERRVLGHEIAGEIVKVGKLIEGCREGMRVTATPNIGCGLCEFCRDGYNNMCPNYEAFGISIDGGFQEYMRVPHIAIKGGNVFPIPDQVSFQAAALLEPFSCCYNALRSVQTSHMDTVLVIGAGPIGAMHVLLNRIAGAKTIIYSNASRTMLFNIRRLDWDEKLLDELTVPCAMLPRLQPSSQVYGVTDEPVFFGARIPVAAAVGDQQGALFGQACFKSGMVKATYGTGGSLLMNTGVEPTRSDSGLLTTVAWGLNDRVEYALEGLLFVVGASVQWLRDELKIIHDSANTEYFAQKVNDTNGVYVVPAFVGLSAPYWDQYARGAILGLTRGANRNHIIRATLESIAYQIRDVIMCMEKDSGIANRELKVDGGAARNNFLMQFQADLLGVPVLRPKIVETTARGAAFLAGLATGFWKDQDELVDTFELDCRFEPTIDQARRDELYAGWQRAVERVKDWEKH
jgi:hypothetical protein